MNRHRPLEGAPPLSPLLLQRQSGALDFPNVEIQTSVPPMADCGYLFGSLTVFYAACASRRIRNESSRKPNPSVNGIAPKAAAMRASGSYLATMLNASM